jgi:putative hydrolase of the HAD superfamily
VTSIDLVLFDLNGVLYRYDRDARIAALAALANQEPDAVKAAIWDSGFEDSADGGGMDADAYLSGFGARIGFSLTEADWLGTLRASLSPMAETMALVRNLRPGVRFAVLTNNHMLVLRHFAALYPEAASLAGEAACVSAMFGLRKPNAEVYRRCLRRFGAAPETALFIDDNAANADGAREAGLRSFRYTDPAALAAELRDAGALSTKPI